MPEFASIDPRRHPARFALSFYAVVALCIAAPLPLHVASTVARAVRQDVWLCLWGLAWTSEHMVTQPAGLFDANIFFPQLNTLAYTDHFIGQALLAAPVYWLSDNIALAYNVAWFAALVLTAWGGYLWVRSLIGGDAAGEAAALVAGAFCLLVPGKRVALSQLPVISLQGVPLALYAVHTILRHPSRRATAGLAMATAYAALCSWYTAAYTALLLPLAGGFGVRYVIDEERRWRVLACGVVGLLGAALILVPVAAPYRAVQAEMAFERPLEELVETSLRPVDFISSWSWLHARWFPQGSGAGGHFPGVVALLLALLGVRDGRRRGDPWPLFYALLALGFAVLSLGPRLVIGATSVALPYELLYRFVPGFEALRNPYRAAFFAALLLAVPVGYGARWTIERLRARLLYARRWRAAPRVPGVAAAGWALALLLAAAHLLEAWPGPQQITPLPRAPSAAYRWLAEEAPESAALVWPLPRLLDDNARYQLWTVGSWTPLANGHSGLFPADFVALHNTDAEFPEARFLEFVRERFPVEYLIAHYGLATDAAAVREAAGAAGLEVVWAANDDVIYRIDNGASGGWLHRRLPARMLGQRLIVETSAVARGCGVGASLNGTPVAAARLPDGATGSVATSYTLDLDGEVPTTGFHSLEVYLTDAAGALRVDLRAQMRPRREAALEVNGTVVERGPLVVAVIDADTRNFAFRAAAPAAGGGVAAVRRALAAANPGDELLIAAAEQVDYRFIERLRLLLGAAGGGEVGQQLEELGTTYAFRGRVGAAPGSAGEVIGDDRAALADALSDDCRRASIARFRFAPGTGGQP